MKFRPLFRYALLAVLLAPLAQAHPGHDGHEFTWDFAAGVLHPLTGWDHLLAMIAVGMWAGMLGGKSRWAIPASFICAMTAAALLTSSVVVPSTVEQAIAASLLVLGLAVAFRVQAPLLLSAAVVAVFATFHGFAHGAEIPNDASRALYVAGFAVSTSLLHLAGIGLAYSLRHYERLGRVCGAGVALAGAIALVS